MGYHTEKVLACPKDIFVKSNYEWNDNWFTEIFEWKFVKRKNAEKNPDWVQLIPYVVLKTEDNEVAVFRRVNAGDVRLQGKYIVGIGGHINPVDAPENRNPDTEEKILSTLKNAIKRELSEELGFDIEEFLVDRKYGGTIYSERTFVDRVHVGLLWIYVVDKEILPKLKEVTGELEFVEFRPLNKFQENDSKFETWSNEAIKYLKSSRKESLWDFPWASETI